MVSSYVFMLVKNYFFQLSPTIKNNENKKKGKEGDNELKRISLKNKQKIVDNNSATWI